MDEARTLFPSLKDTCLSYVTMAPRPMPVDGLPVVGVVRPGIYVTVSHSAVTLAPLLGRLVAWEVSRDMELDLLLPYRPGRFLRPARL